MLYRSKKQFIKETALDIIENLSEEQKNSLISNPNPSHYHFTLGIYIRNKYIYKNQLKFHYNHADHLSYEIIDSVLARIVPKYKKGQHRSFFEDDIIQIFKNNYNWSSPMRKLEVVPYNSEWPNMFQKEKIALAQILNDELLNIHHIGSTSIPGLIAKPIIDILIVVKDINKIDEYNAALELIGYEAKGENGIPNRRYFQKGGDNRTHHLHIYEMNDFNITRHIAFRDYLIAHPEQANRYADKKIELVKQNATDIEAYIEGKKELVKELEEHAIEWYEK